MTRRLSLSLRLSLAGLLALASTVGFWAPASANGIQQNAVEQIARSYQLSITNPATHVNLPAVLLVKSATLSTLSPDGSGTAAPTGEIYLTFKAACGPVQSPYGSPRWGHFYSTMAPLPAAALRYVTATGRSYPAKRINPISQANNPNSSSDNGLFDATYYFSVPVSTRTGTIVVAPSREIGTEYVGFVGGSSAPFDIGGPTRIALHFPAELTVTTTTTPTIPATAYTTFASALNVAGSLFGLVTVGIVLLALQRRRRHRSQPDNGVGGAPFHVPSDSTSRVDVVEPRPRSGTTPTPTPIAETRPVHPIGTSTLLVNILGSLEISPALAPASDPVRAIIAYLALNPERPLAMDEIQTAVWPLIDNGTDIKRPAMRNYMVDARKVVGELHLPTASGKPGYALVGVDTDWAEYQRLLAQTQTADKPSSVALRREALALVRGQPFSGDTSRYFTWTFTSSVVYKIVETVTAVAHVLATELVLAGDLTSAEAVLRQGLLIDPASLVLWEDLTDVLLETAVPSLLILHWRSAGLVLRSDDMVALRAREHGARFGPIRPPISVESGHWFRTNPATRFGVFGHSRLWGLKH